MKNIKKLKSFLSGVLVTILVMTLITTVFAEQIAKTITANYRDIKIIIDGYEISPKDANGNIVEPFIVDGTTYLPVRAVAEALGYDAFWNDDANSVILTDTAVVFTAELNNYEPTRSETVHLTVRGGAEFDGLPYTATVYYRTTQTEYNGVVGEPCDIKIGSATPGYKVVVYILIVDEESETEYELVTSFVPVLSEQEQEKEQEQKQEE